MVHGEKGAIPSLPFLPAQLARAFRFAFSIEMNGPSVGVLNFAALANFVFKNLESPDSLSLRSWFRG